MVKTSAPLEKEVEAMNEPKYASIEVQLSGKDGNAFAIMGAVQKALQKAGITKAEIDEYLTEATAGDYDNLLRVTMGWVTVL